MSRVLKFVVGANKFTSSYWIRYVHSSKGNERSLAAAPVQKLEELLISGEKSAILPNTSKRIVSFPEVTAVMKENEPLQSPDYFQVYNLFTVRDLFDARVHLGHKVGSMHPNMREFIFGTRFDSLILDLDITAFHLRQALNFVAHIAYRKGIVLFVSRSPQSMYLVEKTAMECGEYAHCREWEPAILTNSVRKFGGITRLPDLLIMINTLDTIMAQHLAVSHAAKMLIPTVGVVDTNCDPNLITYPIPGNDDSFCAIELYCRLFKEAIVRGKNKRKLVDSQAQASSASENRKQ